MKKFLAFLLVFVLLAVSNVPAYAGQKNGFSYSGKSFMGYATTKLDIVDCNGKKTGTLPENSIVYVKGTDKNNSKQYVIEWEVEGAVPKSGIKEYTKEDYKKEASGNKGNSGNTVKPYFAVVTAKLQMRNDDKEVIKTIPKYALVLVGPTNSKDKSRTDVKYMGITGSVTNGYFQKVEDAICTNIEAQMVYLIKDGKLIAQSKCVTGTAGVSDTPRGAFKVLKMRRYKTMSGINKITGKEYSRDTEFAICYHESYWFHTAPWRSSFGGSIYKENGSLGCTNLPTKFAETQYNNTYIGMRVYNA